jgi:hypothetical protein
MASFTALRPIYAEYALSPNWDCWLNPKGFEPGRYGARGDGPNQLGVVSYVTVTRSQVTLSEPPVNG